MLSSHQRPITFAAFPITPVRPSYGEINAVNGDLTFGTGTLTVNGSSVNGIQALRQQSRCYVQQWSVPPEVVGITTGQPATRLASVARFTSSDFYVMVDGTLNLNSGGSLTTAVGSGDFGNTATEPDQSGTFNLTASAGSQTPPASLTPGVSGNTSGTLAVNSRPNTSGANTLSSRRPSIPP
jgi:hypothetical protein